MDVIRIAANMVIIDIYGNSFLRYMVRNIVGMLAECGVGIRSPHEMPVILAAKSPLAAGIMAPSHGLCLMAIKFSPYISLWAISIEGEEFVFFQGREEPFHFKQFTKTIESNANERCFTKVFVPLYGIGGGWSGKEELREIPEEELRILYEYELFDESKIAGLMCVEKGYGKNKGTFSLRQCDKITTIIKGQRILPNGHKDLIDKVKVEYSLDGPLLLSAESGNWQLTGISYSELNLKTFKGKIPKFCHENIRESTHTKLP